MGVEGDFVKGGKEAVDEGGAEVDEGVGEEEAGSDRGLSADAVELARRLQRQQR